MMRTIISIAVEVACLSIGRSYRQRQAIALFDAASSEAAKK